MAADLRAAASDVASRISAARSHRSVTTPNCIVAAKRFDYDVLLLDRILWPRVEKIGAGPIFRREKACGLGRCQQTAR